jgi:hypothetical protein
MLDTIGQHGPCKLGFEVLCRSGSPYRSGRSRGWIKTGNPAAPAVTPEAEDWPNLTGVETSKTGS